MNMNIKNFYNQLDYDQLDMERIATFRNIDSIMKNLDADSLLDMNDTFFEIDDYLIDLRWQVQND